MSAQSETAALRSRSADYHRQKGKPTDFAPFDLADGRGAGTSYLWGGTLQYTINAFLRTSATYDGRAPVEAPTLHTVWMQVAAVF